MESFMFAPVELLRKGQANEVSQVGPHHPQHSSLSPPGQRCLSLPSLLSLLWDFVLPHGCQLPRADRIKRKSPATAARADPAHAPHRPRGMVVSGLGRFRLSLSAAARLP